MKRVSEHLSDLLSCEASCSHFPYSTDGIFSDKSPSFLSDRGHDERDNHGFLALCFGGFVLIDIGANNGLQSLVSFVLEGEVSLAADNIKGRRHDDLLFCALFSVRFLCCDPLGRTIMVEGSWDILFESEHVLHGAFSLCRCDCAAQKIVRDMFCAGYGVSVSC